jgi:ABC-type multidrug transport system permease subunit
LFGTVFYDLSTGTDSKAYTDRLSFFFFTLMNFMVPHLDDMAELQKDRNLFYRERSCRAYSPFAYWISRLIITFPLNVVGVFIYSFFVYYLLGLRDSDSGGGGYFIYFVIICILADTIAHLTAQVISNISSSMQVAASLFPVFVFFLVGFEGFIVYLPDFPDWISWIAFFSYMRYAFQGFVLNELSGNEDLPFASNYIHNLGFQSLNTGKIFVILIAIAIVTSVVAYLTIYYIRHERR